MLSTVQKQQAAQDASKDQRLKVCMVGLDNTGHACAPGGIDMLNEDHPTRRLVWLVQAFVSGGRSGTSLAAHLFSRLKIPRLGRFRLLFFLKSEKNLQSSLGGK